MTTTDMPKKVHEGQNIKRFREMLGMKQEALAFALGDDWTQSKISHLENKETIEPELLEQVAKILKVTPEAIQKFNEDAAVNIIANTFSDHSTLNGVNYFPSFNPIDKVVELYERMLKEKDELLGKLTDKKK